MALQFDLSAIPAGTTIESATVSLYCFQDPVPEYAVPYEVHQISAAWNASEATWTNATSTQAWLNAGGDYIPTAIDTVTFPLTSTGLWNSFDVTAAVQAFIDDPAANHGVVLFSAPHSGEGAQWYSSECPIDTLRPRVTVTYSTTSVRRGMIRAPLRRAGSGSECVFAADGRIVPAGTVVAPAGVYLRNSTTTAGHAGVANRASR